ncbi:MAG: septum formation protein Maf [Pseudomonadales bacterium]|nr:septum formation protein Maf [Pseudomonadales bacterium]
MRTLILASSSRYRQQQLQTLGLHFSCISPNIDESAKTNETAPALAQRLAEEKARAVAAPFSDALIIGADQTLAFGERILGKPGNYERALQQLRELRGQEVVLYSALALFDSNTQQLQQAMIPTQVRYRHLSDAQLANYLERDQPFDCAGSCKCESLGIALLESIRSDDPSALIGLPLIALTTMLTHAGLSVLSPD